MKRFVLLVLGLCVVCVLNGQPVKNGPQIEKHRIGATWAAWTYTYGEEMFNGSSWYRHTSILDVYPEHETYLGRMITAGGLTLEYGYMPLEWLEIAGAVTWTGYYRSKLSSETGSRISSANRHYVYITPSVNFYWARTPKVRFYSGFGIAVGFCNRYEGREKSAFMAGNFTALGVTVGDGPVYLMSECGYGTKGILNIGIGYRF